MDRADAGPRSRRRSAVSFETLRYGLYNATQGRQVLMEVWTAVKPWLVAQHRLQLEVRAETRSTQQNRKLHACIADIARQVEWAGKHRDIDVWKRLLMAAWLRARGEPLEILPALDGCGVDVVFEKTSNLDVTQCSELLEYVLAWGAEQGVRFQGADL